MAQPLEMDGLDVPPLLLQILDDEPSVTSVRRGLAAQQHARYAKAGLGYDSGNIALGHQCPEGRLVLFPTPLPLPVAVQDFLGRREQRLVGILDAGDAVEEKREVGRLRKSGELGAVPQPYVD